MPGLTLRAENIDMATEQTRWSFRTLILSVMLVLIVVSIGVVGSLALSFHRGTADQFADALLREAEVRVENRLRELPRQAQQIEKFWRSAVASGNLAPDELRSLFLQLVPLYESQSELAYIGLVVEKSLDYWLLRKLPDDSVALRVYTSDDAGKPIIQDYVPRLSGWQPLALKPSDGFDVRNRPFYIEAKAARKPVWTETYGFWRGNEAGEVPGVTFAVPILGLKGDAVAVLDVDFDIYGLSSFFKELSNDVPGIAFLVEERSDGKHRDEAAGQHPLRHAQEDR